MYMYRQYLYWCKGIPVWMFKKEEPLDVINMIDIDKAIRYKNEKNQEVRNELMNL